MSGAQSTVADLDVDLRQLFASLARNWWRILVVALVVTALALVGAWLAKPLYKAETRLLIETRESIFTRPSAGADSDRPILDEEGVTSQVELISSTDILKQVAQKFDLASRPEFDSAAGMSAIGRFLVLVGLRSDPNEMAREDRVLTKMREKLNVYRVDKSRVIVIEFSSQDPKLAAEIPNAIADAYIAVQRGAKQESNSEATDWLAPEIADLSNRVKEAEAKVAAYRAQSDLLVGQNNSVLATQQLSEMSSELSRVRASRAAAEATAQSMRKVLQGGGSLDALPNVLSSSLIQRLRERQVQLKSEIADLSTTLLDNHPRIRALRSQLSDLDRQIRDEARKVLASLTTEAETAQARENQLVADLNRLKAQSARAGEQQVELNALEREANAQRQLLETYMTRYREASSREDRNYLPVDARVFSRAVTPVEPYFPKIAPIAGAAFVASLLLMSVVTLLQELFSGRALRPAAGSRPEPVAEVAMPAPRPAMAEETPVEEEAPVKAAEETAVPASSLSPIVSPLPEPMAEERDVVEEWDRGEVHPAQEKEIEPVEAAALAERSEPEAAPETGKAAEDQTPGELGQIGIEKAAEKVIASGASRAIFVSPEGDEAAASSVLVAREVSDAGLRVILLDMSSSGAASRPMLDDKVLPGITNLLASEAQFSDIIHSDHYSDCHVIPVGTADPVKAMRAADRLPIIMQSLSAAYDVVVVECGPAGADGISRLVADGTEVFVSMIEAQDEVADAAVELIRNGYPDLTLVTPAGYRPPLTPVPGRSTPVAGASSV
ncbi:exopolysaccharide transport family protein [Mesorhizobium sp. SP-1A]|uniref:exopolysaccharide transport family protein n=1 Tax=Mesorhizobium sp. SP-1A TaxID=3077840 RepID=UPI0028F74462|nr:Wzz/FepE/Etk N-terminal domain-containing protein [Mesorhizobium sp. SP-1A]